MRKSSFALAGLFMLAAGPALADSISPLTYTATIAVGESTTVNKVVTVTAGLPTTAQADVYFLTDTTGSMGSQIAAVQTGFSSIVTNLQSLGNIAFGAGEFKDTVDSLPLNNGSYAINQTISTNASLTQNAILGWSANGGGDIPEQNLASLRTAAGDSTGWREGSRKIIVMTSDAYSKSDAFPSAAVAGTTVASTAADLKAAGVTTLAIDSGDTASANFMNAQGQFNGPNSIYAAGADGTYFNSLNPSTLADDISKLIGQAFSKYKTVTLDLTSVPAGLQAVLVPTTYTGSYDRSVDRTFNFALKFIGLVPGTYDFTVRALVDGGIIATERDTITVTAPPPPHGVPEPASLTLMGLALLGLAAAGRRARKG